MQYTNACLLVCMLQLSPVKIIWHAHQRVFLSTMVTSICRHSSVCAFISPTMCVCVFALHAQSCQCYLAFKKGRKANSLDDIHRVDSKPVERARYLLVTLTVLVCRHGPKSIGRRRKNPFARLVWGTNATRAPAPTSDKDTIGYDNFAEEGETFTNKWHAPSSHQA